MAEEVKADYEALEQVAARFDNQSQAVMQMLQQVKSTMDTLLGEGWLGTAAVSFSAEMQGEVVPASQRLIEALADASAATKEIAQTMQQAEDEASGLFRNWRA